MFIEQLPSLSGVCGYVFACNIFSLQVLRDLNKGQHFSRSIPHIEGVSEGAANSPGMVFCWTSKTWCYGVNCQWAGCW